MREIMCDHFQTCLPELKVMRRNDILYIDTFFSSITFLQGYRCWNLHCYAKIGLDIVVPQYFWSQSLSALKSMVTDCGVPHTVHTDNAKEFKFQKWNVQCRSSKNILRHTIRMKILLSAEEVY